MFLFTGFVALSFSLPVLFRWISCFYLDTCFCCVMSCFILSPLPVCWIACFYLLPSLSQVDLLLLLFLLHKNTRTTSKKVEGIVQVTNIMIRDEFWGGCFRGVWIKAMVSIAQTLFSFSFRFVSCHVFCSSLIKCLAQV